MIKQATLDALRTTFGERLRLDENLSRHTSARIGGPADAFLTATTLDDLRDAARIAWSHDLPLRILGGGSNILISDAGVGGLVVYNRADNFEFDEQGVSIDSGASTIQLTRRCAKRGLSGLEWAVGIPGTIGGAIYGNAGAHGGDVAGCLDWVDVIVPGGDDIESLRWSADDLDFVYRASIIKRDRRPCLILRARFNLTPDDPDAIRARLTEYNDYRKRTQPPGATIGSMFKNPPGDYAGRLIEAAGLKGHQIGGAQISEKHANFFLNADDATGADVKALADHAIAEVEAQFGVTIELEIELVGKW